MRLLTTAFLASTLALGTAGIASAQLGNLKDLATDAAKDAAMDKAKDLAADQAGSALGGSALGGLTGGSALGGVAGSAAGALSTQDKITGAKVLLNGGSKTDAAITIAKDRAEGLVKDQMSKGQTHTIIQKGTAAYGSGTKAKESYGSGTPAPAESYGSGTSAPATTTTLNCPSGTKAQPDGTCMITGNWAGNVKPLNKIMKAGASLRLFSFWGKKTYPPRHARRVLVIHHEDSQLITSFRMAAIGRWIAVSSTAMTG